LLMVMYQRLLAIITGQTEFSALNNR